jgi:hypothetical protein
MLLFVIMLGARCSVLGFVCSAILAYLVMHCHFGVVHISFDQIISGHKFC